MSRERKSKSSYTVGYGKPPVATQFKKGQSGNPKGRPPKRQENSGLRRSLVNERIPVSINGKQIKVSRLEACFRRTIDDAIRGIPSARKLLMTLLEQSARSGPLTVSSTVTLVRAYQQRNGMIIEEADGQEEKKQPETRPPVRVKPPRSSWSG